MEKVYFAKAEFTAKEIADLIDEIQDLEAQLDILQGSPKLPEGKKLDLAFALCSLAAVCTPIAANLIADRKEVC